MKRFLALIALVMIVGCGGKTTTTTPTPLPFSWTGDGNPTVQVCPTGVTLNCKNTIDIEDITTGLISSIAVTQTSYTAPDNTHKYEIRTSGYDLNGNPLHSTWEAVN